MVAQISAGFRESGHRSDRAINGMIRDKQQHFVSVTGWAHETASIPVGDCAGAGMRGSLPGEHQFEGDWDYYVSSAETEQISRNPCR